MQRTIHHIHFESIPSTNTWAKENLFTFDTEAITCITADAQTAGRGQFDRKWISPKGVNLYATLCFYESSPCLFLQNLAQLLSISCCRLLETLGLSPVLKWPNDLLLQGKKVGGILCETSLVNNLTGVVLGIGLNINMTDQNLNDIDQPATSLYLATKQHFSIQNILKSLLTYFLQNLETLSSEGFSPFIAYYESKLEGKDRPFLLKKGDQVIYATYQGISKEGRLLLTLPCGTITEVSSRELLV